MQMGGQIPYFSLSSESAGTTFCEYSSGLITVGVVSSSRYCRSTPCVYKKLDTN